MAGNLIKITLCHEGRFGQKTTLFLLDVFHPTLKKLDDSRTFGKKDGKSLSDIVDGGEILKVTSDFVVVAFFDFRLCFYVFVHLFLRAERDTFHTGEHLVVFIVFPISAGLTEKLKGFERFGIAKVRTDAHIDVFALGVETDFGIVGKVGDMLDFIFFAAGFHEFDSFGSRENRGLNRKIFFDDFLHLGFDFSEVFFGEFDVTEVHVIVESFFIGRTVGKICLGIQTFDCLCHDVGGGMANDVEFFLRLALFYRTVRVNDFHNISSFQLIQK